MTRMNDDFTAGGYLPASFLDWDGHVSAVIFTSGCNFRCPWCHNGVLAAGEAEDIPIAGILKDIARRRKFLDGVVISGGEPCIWKGILPLLRELSSLGLDVKLDTNGSRPDVLSEILDKGLACYVAMDVKAPLNAAAYKKATGADADIDKIMESIALIKSRAPSYEFRTTYIPNLHSEEDLLTIRAELGDDAHWVVQCFKPVGCLDPAYLEYRAADSEIVRKLLPDIYIRG